MERIKKTKTLFNDKGSHNIGLLLNVDWFKPFDRSEYKVSALMTSVINLPKVLKEMDYGAGHNSRPYRAKGKY